MTVKLTEIKSGLTFNENIKSYQCATTDTADNYPTSLDCGAGSTMIVIDETLHEVVGTKYFDGANWNTI